MLCGRNPQRIEVGAASRAALPVSVSRFLRSISCSLRAVLWTAAADARARRIARNRSASVESAGTSDNGCDVPARNVRSFTIIRHTVEIGDDDSRCARSVPAEIHSRFGAVVREWCVGQSCIFCLVRHCGVAREPRTQRTRSRSPPAARRSWADPERVVPALAPAAVLYHSNFYVQAPFVEQHLRLLSRSSSSSMMRASALRSKQKQSRRRGARARTAT